MRSVATRLIGPTLLVGSVAAVWVAVGLGPLSSPQTAPVATARDVAAQPAAQPATATVLAVVHAGDRVLLRVKAGSTTTEVEISPSAQLTGTSLLALAAAAASGAPVLARLEYGPDGAVRALTRA